MLVIYEDEMKDKMRTYFLEWLQYYLPHKETFLMRNENK